MDFSSSSPSLAADRLLLRLRLTLLERLLLLRNERLDLVSSSMASSRSLFPFTLRFFFFLSPLFVLESRIMNAM
jgi:hypothetical protein